MNSTARSYVPPDDPQQADAADLLMMEDRLPMSVAIALHITLALWLWAGCVGLVTALMRLVAWL